MRDLTRAADGIARTQPQRHRLDVACPEPDCGARELYRDDGTDFVMCGACGTVWTEPQYADLVRRALDNTPDVISARDAAERLGLKPGTFRVWAHRLKLRKLGTVDREAWYKVVDVDEMRGTMRQDEAS